MDDNNMAKINYLEEREYDLEEIIEAYSDGSIDNFKGDQDFLDFIISYAIGCYLEGPEAYKYQEYAEYQGTLNVMSLDEFGYLGKKLYRLYEICGKDKLKFIEFCTYVGKISLNRMLDKELIDKNLELKEPVPFIDETIVLSTGKKPKVNIKSMVPFEDLSYEEEKEYSYEINRSLRRRINESIKRNNENIELLEETPSYTSVKEKEQEEKNKKMIPEDYSINIQNIFFGSEMINASGGELGINMKMISWFEYTNTDFLNYHIFRSIPTGEYCLLDDDAKIHIPESVINHNNISIGPNTPIRSVQIANIPTILTSAIKKLEEDPIKNEISILDLKSLLEQLELNSSLTVKDLNQLMSIIRSAYELAFGDIFPDSNNRNYEKPKR